MLTFEGAPIQGVGAIIEKLTVNPFTSVARVSKSHHILFYFVTQSLPFQKVQHKVTTLDAQPSSGTTASLIVSVTGMLLVSTQPQDPSGYCTHHPPSRLTTVRTHCSSPRCSILSQRVGATTCTYILALHRAGLITCSMQLQRHIPPQLWLIDWVEKIGECRYVIAKRNSGKYTWRMQNRIELTLAALDRSNRCGKLCGEHCCSKPFTRYSTHTRYD